jgi:hypothetical protein
MKRAAVALLWLVPPLLAAGCAHTYRGRSVLPRQLPGLTREQVVEMLRLGKPHDALAAQLRGSYLVPPFASWTPEQIIEVKEAGASDALIEEMRLASERPPVVYVEQDVVIYR